MNTLYHPDTIAATATAPGEGSVSIVRVSGPDTLALADRVFQGRGQPPSARSGGVFVHGYVCHKGQRMDECLCLIFKAPHSYTGEDVVEFHGHGGTVCARRVLRAVLAAGARPAEAGEFTKRAFLNGRIDLLQAEAVQDLVRAHSERASMAALQQLEGSLSNKFNLIYDPLLQDAAVLEATLDFPEDELPEAVIPNLVQRLETLRYGARDLIATWDEGHLLRDGALVVISGKPNVGKSTLMNLLLEKDRAIVSSRPGTTRDTIEEDLVLSGIPIRLVDTAGLRDTECDIEMEGISRTRNIREQGDLHIYLVDASQPLDPESLAHIRELDPKRCLLVFNKTDLGFMDPSQELAGYAQVKACLVRQEGLQELKTAMADLLGSNLDLSARPHAVISERHRKLLVQSVEEIETAIKLLQSSHPENAVLAASQLRLALELIGQATGREYEEALLDQIFSSFCIGK